MIKLLNNLLPAVAFTLTSLTFMYSNSADAQSCNFTNRCSTLGASGWGTTQNATRTRALARLQIQVNLLNERAEKCGYRVDYSNPTYRPFQKFTSGYQVVVNQAFCIK
jgi:hypothetical protein